MEALTALIPILLPILEELAGVATSATITKIITALEQLLPIIIKLFSTLVPIVQNIITALRGNGNISSDDLDRLDSMETQYDADFESAAQGNPTA